MENNFRKAGKFSLLFILMTMGIKAQLSGNYSVPGSHPSIASFITALNANGVSGAVIVNISAGYTETAPPGGYSMSTISGASSVNQITFQKSGTGPNPLISAYTGTAIPSSARQDGIWIFSGTDFVTVDGINIVDPNTTNPATMEFAYGFFRANATDGCQNNTIKNCVITLRAINNAPGAGPAVDGSRGIDVVNASPLTHTTALTITSATGANSNNKFYANTIQNCNIGIALIGFADTTPFGFADTGNDVGGTSPGTGNMILNFGGGGSTSAAAAVRTLAQYDINVSYNNINSNNSAGVNHAAVLRGIYLNTATSANATISNNTITTHGGGTSQQNSPIENASGSTPANNIIRITNNLITNCTYPTATSGSFIGINNNAAGSASLTISGNTITNNATNATSGSHIPIYNSGAVTSSIAINNNNINGSTFNALATSLIYRGIYNVSGGGSSTTLTINGNNIQAISFVGAGSGDFVGIQNAGSILNQNINNNTFTNFSLNTSGTSYLILCNNNIPANGIRTITGNSIVTGYAKLLSGGTVYGYFASSGSSSSATEINANNNFSNINVTGSTVVEVLRMTDGSGFYPFGPTKIIANNTLTNITAGTGQVTGIYTGYNNLNAPATISNNIISNVTCSSTAIGIYLLEGSHDVYNNTVKSFTSSGVASTIIGINVDDGAVHNIYRNKIYDLVDMAVDGAVAGLSIAAGITTNIYNNLVGDMRTPVVNSGNAIAGISVSGGTTHNVYFNTININATSSGANFGTSAINVNTVATTINLRNNIFVNNSVATGTGITVAYRRSGTSLVNYATSSNNNLFYAGIPGNVNLIFHDGTTGGQTLAAYKTLVSPRDAVSVTENPAFLSILGTNANFLNISPVVPTYIDAGALPLPGITNDYAGTPRNFTTPDIGAWEGNYVGVPCIAANGGTLSIGAATACVGQTLVAPVNGVSTGSTISYQWKSSLTPGGPYVPITTGSGNTTPTYTSLPLTGGTFYLVLQTTCAAANLTGVSNEATITVNAVPTATASTSTPVICTGDNLIFSGNSNIGTMYSWYGPNNFVSPSQNPAISNAATNASGTYSLVSSLNGCSSTVTAVVSVTVNITPSAITVTPLSATICVGGSQTLGLSGGVIPATFNFTPQVNQNTVSVYPAPYTAFYGGQKMQFLVLASELTLQGLVAGPLTSIQFPVVSKGVYWGYSIYENQNFQVSIKATALTSVGATFESGLTIVAAAINFTPTVGYNNIHNFGTPFYWDGISNLIIETVFSNNMVGTLSDAVSQYFSPTTFQSTMVYRVQSQTFATVAAATTTNMNTTLVRPDFKLNGSRPATFTWTPGTGLTTTTGPTVNATPLATSVYTVKSSFGACSSSTSVNLSVTQIPTLSIAATTTTVCVGSQATLTASGAASYTWSNNSNLPVQVVSPTVNSVYTVTYQTLPCPLFTQTINIATNPLPIVSALSSATSVCAGQGATLTGAGTFSYSWVSGPSTGTYAVNPVINTTYTVTGTDALGCSNKATVNVAIDPAPILTITPAAQTVCTSSQATFTASGANTYSWSSGSLNAIEIITPSASAVYTVTGIGNEVCPGSQTVALMVSPCAGIVTQSLSVHALNVFPNPSTGFFTAKFEFEGEKTILIMNSVGQVVSQTLTSDMSADFNLGGMAKGIYFVRVSSKQASGNYKIVIN